MGGLLKVFVLSRFAYCLQLHLDYVSKLVLQIFVPPVYLVAVVVLGPVQQLPEPFIVLLYHRLLGLRQLLKGARQNALTTQICDIAGTVPTQPHCFSLFWLFAWAAKCLVVLLPDELKELSHLSFARIPSDIVRLAARTVPIGTPVLIAEQALDDTLQGRRQSPLRSDEPKYPCTLLVDNFTHFVVQTVWVRPALRLCSFQISLELRGLVPFVYSVTFHFEELLLGLAEVVLEDLIHHLDVGFFV